MYTDLLKNHRPLFAPPLPFPLKIIRNSSDTSFKAEGLFGDYRNHQIYDGIQSYRPHEGIDFRVEEGTPVFAARPGWVVAIDELTGPSNKKIVIRHIKEAGAAFCTRYLHVKNPVVPLNSYVHYGDKIAEVGKISNNIGIHLHFEIHLMMTEAAIGPENWKTEQTEKVDPLPHLYRWEKIYYERILGNFYSTLEPAKLDEIAVMRYSGISIFRVIQNGQYYFLPLPYLEPGEEELIHTLENAFFNGHKVRLAVRETEFFKLTSSEQEYKLICAARIMKKNLAG